VIVKIHNLLNQDECSYLNELINDKNKWEYRTRYDSPRQYFDSLVIDKNRLKSYFNIITNNGEFTIGETGLNVITVNTQLKSSKHTDESDLSYATYLNDDFSGGEFVYYENKKPIIVIPEKGLTIKITKDLLHEVKQIKYGTRFSLYTFLRKEQKINKTLI
jgi:hypothetical protein